MQKKSGVFFFLFVCMMCVLCTSCKKQTEEKKKPLQEVWTVYETENVLAYTLDKDGMLYAFELVEQEEKWKLFLNQFDLEGKRVTSREIDSRYNSYVSAMTIKDGLLYFAPYMYTEGAAVLHSYNLETGEITAMKAFPYFEEVKRIVVEEERIYLIGTNKSVLAGNSASYVYTGEKIMYYAVEEDAVYTLGIEEPLDISENGNGQLMVYAHTEDGFCFFLYDSSRDAMKLVARSDAYKMRYITLCGNGEDVIYQSVESVAVSSFSKLNTECELYPNSFFFDNSLCCVNGRVACFSKNRKIIQFSLDEVRKENKELHYISAGYSLSEPYGCGYEMQRTTLEADKFALKVMALDEDFDVCMVDTWEPISYNLKTNGVFYPLNDVPGVQEYLDACFPYVREAATDEEGNIWMLPIEVNIPGFVVNQEVIGNDTFQENMSFKDYFLAQSALTKEEQKGTIIPWIAFVYDFFRQYFATNSSVDTELFRSTITLFSSYFDCIRKEEGTTSKAVIYEYVRYAWRYRALGMKQFCENPKVYSVPKLSVDAKNIGTCVFLAVNPYSDNLDATLDYLSSFVAYTMRREEVPLFFQNRVVEDTVYEKSLYELYQNGEIGFTLDNDIYDGYEEVFEDSTKLETYVMETERKLKIYFNE